MREIKFRAWDKVEKKMLFNADPFAIHVSGSNEPLLAKTHRNENCIFEQYTGLKDKNGKEIYEGDIVRYGRHIHGIIPPESHMEIVSWQSGEEEHYPCCTSSGFALPYSEDGYEVIGNIHENPELLEQEDAKN